MRKKGTTKEDYWVTRTCEICGEEFEYRKCWLRSGREGRFCSRACVSEHFRRQPHPNFHVVLKCRVCGKEYSVKRFRAETSVACSDACRAKYVGSLNRKADKGRNIWEDSHISRLWRAAILERDGAKCQMCGSKANLETHHIMPVSVRPDLASRLWNGITLCRPCHLVQTRLENRSRR